MKRKFNSTILRCGGGLFIACLLASGLALRAQHVIGGFFLNGSNIGTILLKTCDLNQDGVVTLAELKTVAAACFKTWDTNNVGTLTQSALIENLKQIFPAPSENGGRVVGVGGAGGGGGAVGGGMQVDLPALLTKHIMAKADSNKDGLLSLQEFDDYLDNSFGQWDQDGNGALDVRELGVAFALLARPDFNN